MLYIHFLFILMIVVDMETKEIIILIICILALFITLSVLNNLFSTRPEPVVVPQPTRQEEATAKLLMSDPIYLPKISTASEKKLEPDADMISKYYENTQIKSDVYGRDDYVKPLGQCPFSKPMSTALPMANVPMSMAQRQDNMYLA